MTAVPNLKPALIRSSDNSIIVAAGPCSAESESQVLDTARQLSGGRVDLFRAGLWKPRTKPGGFEGVGARGLPWLISVKEKFGMPVATEVASERHVQEALEAGVDFLWIGARTTANPFAVQEIANAIVESGKADSVGVLIKNPVNPDVELWDGAIQRFARVGVQRISAVHRGFTPLVDNTFRNSPHWAIANELRVRYPHLQMICDPSHIGGKRELVASISQTAIDLGFDGLMVETHCDPSKALSDAAQQLTPDELFAMLDALHHRDTTAKPSTLDTLRSRIDAIDLEILDALRRRMDVSREIGQLKRECRMPVVQPERYNDMLSLRLANGSEMGLGSEFVMNLFREIHAESIANQIK